MRLPSRVTLPFGYVVLVKELTDAEMRAEEEAGELCDGLWDAEAKTIFVRKDLPLKRKRYILWHELGHALWDGQHCCFDEGAFKP
jgi:Zn-dependent peptidase ImmA (M78 family)